MVTRRSILPILVSLSLALSLAAPRAGLAQTPGAPRSGHREGVDRADRVHRDG